MQYLQNLGLIEESFNKGNVQNKQNNSEPKAHEAYKTAKATVETAAESTQTMIIPGLTTLIIQRVRISKVTRMPTITTTP
jgi:hypothetical protein